MAHSFRMANRIDHPRATLAQHSKKNKTLKTGGLDNCLQVFGVLFEGEFDALAIRQTAAAPVVANDAMAPRHPGQPGTPDRTFPIEFEMAYPMSDPHQRWAPAASRVGDACAIAARAKSDLLRRVRHRDTTGHLAR